jgi:hypothetical protein
MYIFGIFVENQLAKDACIYFWVLNFISLVYMSVFVPKPSFFCYYGCVVYLEIRYCNDASIALFTQIALAIQS